MRTLSESIIGRKGIQPSTSIISDCRDMISKIDQSPWKEAVAMATDYYNVLIQNMSNYPKVVQQILKDSINELSNKYLSEISRINLIIWVIRSISKLAKKQRS